MSKNITKWGYFCVSERDFPFYKIRDHGCTSTLFLKLKSHRMMPTLTNRTHTKAHGWSCLRNSQNMSLENYSVACGNSCKHKTTSKKLD